MAGVGHWVAGLMAIGGFGQCDKLVGPEVWVVSEMALIWRNAGHLGLTQVGFVGAKVPD